MEEQTDQYKIEIEGALQNCSSEKVLYRIGECILNPEQRLIEGRLIFEILSESPYFAVRESVKVYQDLMTLSTYHSNLKNGSSPEEFKKNEEIERIAIRCMKNAEDLRRVKIFSDQHISLVNKVVNNYLEENAQSFWLKEQEEKANR